MTNWENIEFPFHGRTSALEVAGWVLRVRADRKFDDRAVALEVTAKPERNSIRVPLDLVHAFDQMFPSGRYSTVTRSICVHWEGLKDPTFMTCRSLTPWPSAATSRQASWAQWNTSTVSWVGYEPVAHSESGSDHVLLYPPRSKVQSSASYADQVPHNVWLRSWSANDRPHLWPRYSLYGGTAGQLILYTMGGLANGRFKLAKRQLDDFLTLRCKGPLRLGFYDEAQGIDISYPLEGMKLPLLKNADGSEPYYLIDVTRSAGRTLQISLEL